MSCIKFVMRIFFHFFFGMLWKKYEEWNDTMCHAYWKRINNTKTQCVQVVFRRWANGKLLNMSMIIFIYEIELKNLHITFVFRQIRQICYFLASLASSVLFSVDLVNFLFEIETDLQIALNKSFLREQAEIFAYFDVWKIFSIIFFGLT